ncbi:MAG: hypothetical protein E6J94_09600 [Methanobacteriota archaeon]|nr:MAG: hypothetical protein E6J94_09600 [Euryarchaeota archaeon]
MEASVPRPDAGVVPPPRSQGSRVVLVGVVALLVVVAILAATAYLGLGPFGRSPGSPNGNGGGTNPCAGAAFFSVVASVGGTLTFNGTTPGPVMTVANQTAVCVKLSVDPTAGISHSFKIVVFGGTASTPTAFPGANTTDPMIGTQPGASQTIRFVASPAGAYEYLCGVDGHAATMWGYFNVTA